MAEKNGRRGKRDEGNERQEVKQGGTNREARTGTSGIQNRGWAHGCGGMRGFQKGLRRDWRLWVMVIPAVAAVLVFCYWPMYGIQLAFREYSFKSGLTGGTFAGLKYFEQFITNYQFKTLIANTLKISVGNILFGFPAPIILALLLNQLRSRRIKKAMQTIVYLPHFISTVVMVSLLTVLLSPNSGLIGRIITAFSDGNVNLLGDTSTFLGVYIGSEIWQHCGWNCIIYLAALSAVDTQLYDAARIDGASRWQIMRYVELPALTPTIVMLFILQMGGILNTGFEKIYLMQNTMNLPVSEVISTYVYKMGLESNQISYASAISLFNTLINFAFLYLTNCIAKRKSDISLW